MSTFITFGVSPIQLHYFYALLYVFCSSHLHWIQLLLQSLDFGGGSDLWLGLDDSCLNMRIPGRGLVGQEQKVTRFNLTEIWGAVKPTSGAFYTFYTSTSRTCTFSALITTSPIKQVGHSASLFTARPFQFLTSSHDRLPLSL